ncbi:MAG TPA: STT3 domain-containing protein [Candidatus Omnitrophota bacterium]|nr:STT3 domain-containing protein [Candidatus Omnitrophota bacterium]
MNKISRLLPYVLVYLISLALGLYFRLYPLLTYTSSGAQDLASVYVIAQIKQNITQQVEQKFPQLDALQKKILARKLFDEHLHERGSSVREAIDRFSHELGSHIKEGRATPYLLASDGYYYYGLTEHILSTGKISDQIRGSKYFHPLMQAPQGQWEPLTLHPYVGAFVYRILKIVSPSIDLMHAISYTPLVLVAMTLIVFILFCFFLGLNPLCTFVASTFFLLSPIFVKRSMFAWYDNDPYTFLFPLLIMYFFLNSVGPLIAKNKAATFSLLTLLSILLYSYFWQGWIFIFCVVAASMGFILAYRHIALKKPFWSKEQAYFLIPVFGTIVGIAMLFGTKEFFVLFREGWNALNLFLHPQLSAWPNLYIGVSELKESGWPFLTEQLGGPFFMGVCLLGFLFSISPAYRREKEIGISLMLYALISLIVSLRAQRFVTLSHIPFSLGFALGVLALWQGASWLLTRMPHKNFPLNIAKGIMVLALLSTVFIPVRWLNRSVQTLLNPIFNQTWEKALVAIRDKTPAEAIVNTWWPPGHFIKAIAKRRVTFDGASIGVPQGYWITTFFLSPSEKEAFGILRMLNTSGNEAVEQFQAIGLDLATAVLAVKDITLRPRDEAHGILLETFKNYQLTNRLLAMTHATPPPSYILVYNEFVENNLQLKFIAGWNFKGIEAINQDPARLKAVPPARSPEFIQFLWKLAGGPYKYSGVLASLGKVGNQFLFEENVTVDEASMLCRVGSPQFGTGIPQSIFYLKNDEVIEQKLPMASLPYSAVLFEKNGTKGVVLMDRPLAQSLLVKLYFFEGKGLKSIKPFVHERDLTGRTDIYVFEVDWQGLQ